MIYINALELIDLCIEHSLLKEKNDKVFIYRAETPNSKEGWYLTDKDTVAKELMNDKAGQKTLINALKEKGVEFKPTNYSWMFYQDSLINTN